MKSQWDWIFEYEEKAWRENDSQRMRLAALYRQSCGWSHDFPEEKWALHVAGRDLARQLGEPWWEMFYAYWMVNVLVFDKRQPELALDHAVRAVFETSKPIFADFPQRIGLQMSLAAAYRDIDPFGYETELREVFRFLEANCDGYEEHRPYYAQLWSDFLQQIEDAGAVDAAYESLKQAENSGLEHYIWEALRVLCASLYRFDREGARQLIGELAATGEGIARRQERTPAVAEFTMWRALAARWDGREEEAKRLYHQALQKQTKIPPPQIAALYAAMAFHEAGGETERALQICQSEIRILHRYKFRFLEAQRRVDKCRLLKQMGRDFSREAKRLRRVAAKLKSQSHWDTRLAGLEASAQQGA